MKLRSLITTVLLGTAVLARSQTGTSFDQVQEKPAPQAPKAGVVKDPKMNADGSVTLSAGPLKHVVAEIERRIPYWMETEGGKDWVMPNIVFGSGTDDAEVPTPMRLRQVSPIQALALVAAAAGCSLESIFAPAEKAGDNAAFGSSKPFPIIGYRIVMGSASVRPPSLVAQQISDLEREIDMMSATYSENHPRMIALRSRLKKLQQAEDAGGLAGIGIALGRKDDKIVVQEVIPGSPASLSPAIRPGDHILSVAEAGKQDLDVTGLGLEKVVQLIRGPPGTTVKITLGADSDNSPTQHVVSLVRTRLPIPSQETADPQVKDMGLPTWFGHAGYPNVPLYSGSISSDASAKPPQNNSPFVRVFALGSVISGSPTEVKEKEDNLVRLVEEALEIGGVATQTTRRLSFHTQSRTLIFKGTAKEHEIIEQVIRALKENETQGR